MSPEAWRLRLVGAGVPTAALSRVHGPIGLDIDGRTVPEIAPRIAAELVAVRRGHQGAADPMKMPADEVARWLARTARG